MKKFLINTVLMATLVSGCTKEELINAPNGGEDAGKVRFSATTRLATSKAAPGNPYASTDDLQGNAGNRGAFHVVGYAGTTEIVGTSAAPQVVTFNGVSWEYGNEPYWPNTTMNFYAYANWTSANVQPTIAFNGITATNVIVAADNIDPASQVVTPGQKDLLVALTQDARKETRTLLTFKHALTQIVFKAGNLNSGKIAVDISGVEIVHVGNQASLRFVDPAVGIEWSAPADQSASYSVQGIGNFSVPAIAPANIAAYNNYPRVQTAADPANNALMLIPQMFDGWSPANGSAALSSNAYIKVACLIKDANHLWGTATDGSDDAENNKFIYAGTSENGVLLHDHIYIPVESKENQAGKWDAGKRINYIITFGDSNSGSGGGGYDNNGDPILVPIRFRAVVEDWVDVNVPLLTATFEANSSAITHTFIDGYTNQLLNDIKAAAAPKEYQAMVVFKGTNSNNIGGVGDRTSSNEANHVSFQSLLGAVGTVLNGKFRPGSTLTYDLHQVTNRAVNSAKITVPEGWTAKTYTWNTDVATTLGGTATDYTGGAVITTSASEDFVVLTKIPATGYNYLCRVGFVEDNLAAVELNENYVTPSARFDNLIYIKGEIPTPNGATLPNHFRFSSDILARFVASDYNSSTVTLDLTDVTGWDTTAGREVDIATWCPTGWSVSVGANTYYPGDLVKLTAAEQIVYTKVP